MRKLLLIAGLAAFGFAQEEKKPAPAEPVEVKVSLEPARASNETQLGYSKARIVPLETNAPRFLFEVPEFRSKEPLFFRVAMGETKGIPFYGALDQSGKTGHYDLLYLDKNRDLDLTNDGKPVEARVRTSFSTNNKWVEFLGLSLDLPFTRFGKQTSEPYGCVLFFVVEGKKRPVTIQIERDGWRQGKVTLKDGKSYRVVLIDDDSDGQYTTSDAWAMKDEGTELSKLLEFDATRPPGSIDFTSRVHF